MIRRAINRKLESRPRAINDWLKKHGNKLIVSAEVCRKPVTRIFQTVLNLLSKGSWEDVRKKYNYDDIYHLWAVLTLSDGSKWHIEKNQRVIIKPSKPVSGKDCRGPVSLGVNVNTFIERGEASGRYFWRYTADVYNCQHFIRTLFNRSGVKSFDSFITQNTQELLGPGTRKTLQALSDVAAATGVVLSGGSKTRPKRKRKKVMASSRKPSARAKRAQSGGSKCRCKSLGPRKTRSRAT